MINEYASHTKNGNIISAVGTSRNSVIHALEECYPGIREAKGLFKDVMDKKRNQYRLRVVLL